jgi:hypothetical protein
LHLSKMDFGGGAADGFVRIHRALLSQGVKSVAYVLKCKTSTPFIVDVKNLLNPLQTISWALVRIFAKLKRAGVKPVGVYDFDSEANFPAEPIIRHAKNQAEKWDLILVHWSGGFVCTETVKIIATALGARIALWQVDMAHATGGCHSTLGCLKYQTGCGVCPLILSENPRDISAIQAEKRAATWKGLGAVVLAPSTWSARQAKESFTLRNLNTFILPIPINLDVFRPSNADEARAQLGLPMRYRIVLVRGIDPSISYKGFSLFISAIRILDNEAVNLHIAVIGDPGFMPSGLKHITFTELGRLDGDGAVALAYQASDFFVSPSINDAGPMMIGEAMACGRPFIAYPVGVASDFAGSGLSGMLVEPIGDVVKLAAAIRLLVELPEKDLIERQRVAAEAARESLSVKGFTEKLKRITKNDLRLNYIS